MAKYRSLIFTALVIITLLCCLGFRDKPLAVSSYSNGAPEDDYTRLFDDGIFHHLTIKISDDEWNGMSSDMQEYAASDPGMRTQNYRRADIIYEDDFGTIDLGSVGIRTHGTTARVVPEDKNGVYHRTAFALKFDETFGLAETDSGYYDLKYRLFCGLEKLILKWNQWEDLSHIREAWCYDALNEADLMAPKASLVSLDFVIGGKTVHYGVYTMIEPVDKKFLTKRLGKGQNDGDLYKCSWENLPASLEYNDTLDSITGIKNWEKDERYSYDLKTNTSSADFSDIKTFIQNINSLNDADFAQYINDNFDVDSFLKLMAMDVLLGDPDDYRTTGNNYYLYFNGYKKIEMIPYDYNASLGAGWNGGDWGYSGIASGDIYSWRNINSLMMQQTIAHPLFDRIIKIDAYKQKYEYYLKNFIDSGIFSYQSFLDDFNSFKFLYGSYASSDTAETGEEMKLSDEQWFFDTKISSVESQLTQQTISSAGSLPTQ